MQNNPEYLTDFSLNQGLVLKCHKLENQSMELANEVAELIDNQGQELKEHEMSNQELQYEYEEKIEKLKDLYEQNKAKKAELSKAGILKTISQHTSGLNKDSSVL